jgi:folate-dependent phosphoribosylglycinamide formyltransferase PurN
VSDSPRVIVLTSTFLRHQFVADVVAARLNVVGVWQEEKSFKPERYAVTAGDSEVIAGHFARRDQAEAACFGDHRALRLPAEAVHRTVAPGAVNEPAEVDLMGRLDPAVVLVFGTGLLRAGIIDRFGGRIINLHLGLSPYYRGAGTNFWPLVNREPEYVGATIHYLDAGIDTGPLIAHSRPQMAAGDGPHQIGNKAIVAAADVLVAAARAHLDGRVRPVPQSGGGRLYQRKDFSASAVLRLQENFATGMIPEYLTHRSERDARLSLASLEGPR